MTYYDGTQSLIDKRSLFVHYQKVNLMGEPEKVKAGTFETLIEAGGIRSACAIENNYGNYLLLVETGSGMPMLLNAQNGRPRTFEDLEQLGAYCENYGIHNFEVIKQHGRCPINIDPDTLSA